MARPRVDRYNSRTVPLGGGAAIFATMFIFLTAGILAVRFIVAPGRWPADVAIHAQGFVDRTPGLVVIIGCITALFIMGLYDDKKHLGPYTKLLGQFAVAIAAVALAQVRLDFFIYSTPLAWAVSVVWIVVIINAFNFLDNMDGLAAGIAMIVTAILLAAAVLSGQVFVSAMALLFIGTLAGFLVFNFPPARIFMGDAGSLVMGFVIALLSVRTTYYHQAASGQWYPVLLPLVALAVPLYDFASVMTIRLWQGKSPFVGDTQHFSHRLRKLGLSDTQTVLTVYLATFCTALAGTFLYQVNLVGALLIMIQTAMILAIIAIFEVTARDKSE